MAAVNSNWQRWVYASISAHLHTAATAASIPLVVEFTDERSDAWKSAPSKAEATITGPSFKELSRGEHRVQAGVTIQLSTHKDANDYDHLDSAGALQNALDQCIVVKQYGPGVSNPATVGTITPRQDAADDIGAEHVKPTDSDQLNHTIIAARFEGLFTE